jgi:NAD(P)-dependent dehydrogenase (short-subunit alcohol dehydrogenase family)
MIDLSGRTALVTGAGRNVGAGIAAALGRCGAAIAVNDLVAERADSVVAELAVAGVEALAIPADVTDHAAVEAMVRRAREHFGAVDILVNNAGIPAEGAPSVVPRDADGRLGPLPRPQPPGRAVVLRAPSSTTCAIAGGGG